MKQGKPYVRKLAIGLAAAFALVGTNRALGQESVRDVLPTPFYVYQSRLAIELLFSDPEKFTAPSPMTLKEWLKNADPFFRDAKVGIHLRTYVFDSTSTTDKKAWAGGGWITAQSGYWLNFVSLGAVFYTSLPLWGPACCDGTLTLAPGQDSYAVLGQAYARFKLNEQTFFTAGRYFYDTPYLGPDDSRMTPNTFMGYVLQGTLGSKDGPNIKYGAGYISDIKNKNASSFISMSRDAGATVDRGVIATGALFTNGPFSIGAINYYSDDIINIGYGETKYRFDFSNGLEALIAGQYVDQRSVGSDLLKGMPFQTDQFAVKTELGMAGWIFTAAYSLTASGSNMQNPWSGNPVYTGAMVQDFNRAGEYGALFKLSYDFAQVGAKGWTAYVLYAFGSTNVGTPVKENEWDFDLQWRPDWGDFLKGISFRARYGIIDVNQAGVHTGTHQFRFIVNYDIPIL